MSEPRDVQRMLELAEKAAIDGDFSSADQLLRDAARLQEAEMGPTHPDLANTMNSLAIVAERTGRFSDAEAFYRRSAAIASQSLPADHPIVAESRKNLEDFCRERGVPLVPIAPAAATTPGDRAQPVAPNSFVPETTAARQESAPPATTAKSVSKLSAPPSSPGKPSSPATRVVAARAPVSFPPARRKSWGRVGWLPFAAVLAVAVAVLMRQPSPSEEGSTTVEMSPATELAPPPPSSSASLPPSAEPTQPEVASQDGTRSAGLAQPASGAPSPDSISLTTAQLCQTFSPDRDDWHCEPPGETMAGGPIVFYTRVRSPRDTEVVHRWYYGDTLDQTVRLMIRANASEGYRTYSRHLVDRAGDWRVQAMSDSGNLLHEERFTVR